MKFKIPIESEKRYETPHKTVREQGSTWGFNLKFSYKSLLKKLISVSFSVNEGAACLSGIHARKAD